MSRRARTAAVAAAVAALTVAAIAVPAGTAAADSVEPAMSAVAVPPEGVAVPAPPEGVAVPMPPDEPAGPPTVTPADIRFVNRTLRTGTPEQVGLRASDVAAIGADAAAYLAPTADHPTWPAYAGAVVLAAKDGVIVADDAVGTAVRYSAVGPAPARAGLELPAAQQIPARTDTLFDIASMSKLFTTIVVMQLVEAGQVNLDAPVATYLPEFAAGGKQAVTVRHLLTHTAGLPAWSSLYTAYPTPGTRLAAALATPLPAGVVPGERYLYSDLGLIALGELVHRVTGTPLDQAVYQRITGPLGMRDTMYNPPASLRDRIAATEDESYAGRGMVWGQVHDENAWALGGVAGHAGIFATAGDLAILAQMLLNGGQYGGVRILAEDTIRSMLVNYNAPLEARYPESDRGLGFELNKHWYMGPLSSPVTFGHTGFTGTSIVVDPLSHSFLILLSNRVHPSRDWGSNNVARRAVAYDLGDAMPVRPVAGDTAWRADRRDNSTVTLVAPLRAVAVDATWAFRLWYDTEPRYDVVRFEASADGVTWTALPVTLWTAGYRWTAPGRVDGYGDRRWWQARASLPDGTTMVRVAYRADSSSQGRGVYVDGVSVESPTGTLFDGEVADAGAFWASGWTATDH